MGYKGIPGLFEESDLLALQDFKGDVIELCEEQSSVPSDSDIAYGLPEQTSLTCRQVNGYAAVSRYEQIFLGDKAMSDTVAGHYVYINAKDLDPSQLTAKSRVKVNGIIYQLQMDEPIPGPSEPIYYAFKLKETDQRFD